MTAYAKHSALFFLFIFTTFLIGSNVIKGFSNHVTTTGSGSSVWKTNCQKPEHVGHVSQDGHQFSTTKELPSSNEQPADFTNCNTSLQILPAVNHFLFEPDQKDQPLLIRSPFLTSQLFVFQEPDPPRFV